MNGNYFRMNPSDNSPRSSSYDAINEAAATWLARRDGGVDPAEAALFARWREADPRHAAALKRAENTQNFLARLPETPAAAAMLAEVDALCAKPAKVIRFPVIWKLAAGIAAAACLTFYFSKKNKWKRGPTNQLWSTASTID